MERVRALGSSDFRSHRPEGEQYVVRRIYYEPKLSTDHDVLTASHIAWTVVGAFLRDAHNLLGFNFDDHDDEHSEDHDVEQWWDYLETDAHPEILQQWGWR